MNDKPKVKVIEVKEAPQLRNGAMQYGITNKESAQSWGEKNGFAVVYFNAKRQRVYAERIHTRIDEQAQKIEGQSEKLLAEAEESL